MLALPLLTVLPLALGLTVPLDTTLKSFTNGRGDVKLGRPLAQVNGALKHVTNLDLNTGVKPRHSNLDLESVTKLNADLDAAVHHVDHAVHHLDLDLDAVSSTTLSTRTTGLLPDLAAGASFCITLGADLTLDNGVFLAAGVCLCADAIVEGNPLGPVRVVSSSGAVIEGALAVKLRNSMLFGQYGTSFDLNGLLKVVTGEYLNLLVAGNICLQIDLFIGHSEHDFSQVGNCCARRCIAPYVSGPNDQCICPAANQCKNQCLSGPALECNGACYLQSEYTCPSGMPQLKQQGIPGRKRHVGSQCQGYGKEMCAVSGSVGFECIDIHADIESCGGCVLSLPGKRAGTDCTSIPFVDEVLCHLGDCLVVSCEKGYKPARNGTLCIDINLNLDLDAAADLRTNVYGKTAHRLDTVLELDASVH